MKTKVCKRCGVEQPLEEFRTYYNRPGTHYAFCKTCERIEARRKYLRQKGETLSVAEQKELKDIEALYEKRGRSGLAVPGSRKQRVKVSELVRKELAEHEDM